MTFGEASRIYKSARKLILEEMESTSSGWTLSETICRLAELERSFKNFEMMEAMNILNGVNCEI